MFSFGQKTPATGGFGGTFGQQNTTASGTTGWGQPQQGTTRWGQPQQPQGNTGWGQQQSTPSAGTSGWGQGQNANSSTTGVSLFGQQPQQQSGGLFGSTQPTTSGGLFGASTTQPQQSTGLFGQAQPQQSGGLFGQTQPQLGTGLFGQSQSGGGLFGQTQPQQQQQQGGMFGQTQQTGGLFGQKPQGGMFGQSVQQQPQQPAYQLQKNTKYNELPPEIQKKLDEFHKLITDQNHVASTLDIQLTRETIKQTEDGIKSILQKFILVENTLDKDSRQVARVKESTQKEIENFQMSFRLFDNMMRNGGPGAIGIAERPFYNPQDYITKYFSTLIEELENLFAKNQSIIADLDRQFSALSSSISANPNLITEIIKNNYSAFFALASRIATLHGQIEKEKEQFLTWKRNVLNDLKNPFEQPKRPATDSLNSGVGVVKKIMTQSSYSDMAKRFQNDVQTTIK